MSEDAQTIVPGGGPDIGSRISRALSIYASRPFVFLAIASINFPLALLGVLWEWGWVLSIPSLFLGQMVGAAVTFAAYQCVTAGAPSFSGSVGAGFKRVGSLLEYTVRSLGAFVLLCVTIIGIPWGMRILVRWFLGIQAIMLYNDSAVEAISRSARLVAGDWWRVLGNLLAAVLLTGSGGIALSLIGGTLGGVSSAVWGTLAAPFLSIFTTLLFLRLAKEKGEPPPPLSTLA